MMYHIYNPTKIIAALAYSSQLMFPFKLMTEVVNLVHIANIVINYGIGLSCYTLITT